MPDPTDLRPVPPVSSALDSAHFDAAAATWDENSQRRALTAAIASAIQRDVPLDRHWRVLEYGCGTASLGLVLAPHVQEVVAADASPGMIEQVRRKLAATPVAGLTPCVLDLTSQEPPAEQYHLIVMAMVLHHVADTTILLGRLAKMLAPGGTLAVVDLCQEDGSFHAPREMPHNGFAPAALAEACASTAGLTRYASRVIHHFEKNGRSYPIFLLTAQRD